MQIRIFSLPATGSLSIEEEINKFLRSHRILKIDRRFCEEAGGYWTMLVEYMDGDPIDMVAPAVRGRNRQDATVGLTENQKMRFEKMRKVRMDIARRENVRAYMVFTDKELVAMAQMESPVISDLVRINGVSRERATKYGEEILDKLRDDHEESGVSDAENMPF